MRKRCRDDVLDDVVSAMKRCRVETAAIADDVQLAGNDVKEESILPDVEDITNLKFTIPEQNPFTHATNRHHTCTPHPFLRPGYREEKSYPLILYPPPSLFPGSEAASSEAEEEEEEDDMAPKSPSCSSKSLVGTLSRENKTIHVSPNMTIELVDSDYEDYDRDADLMDFT